MNNFDLDYLKDNGKYMIDHKLKNINEPEFFDDIPPATLATGAGAPAAPPATLATR